MARNPSDSDNSTKSSVSPDDVCCNTKEEGDDAETRGSATNQSAPAREVCWADQVRSSQKRDLEEGTVEGGRRVVPRTELPFDENESIEKIIKVHMKKDDAKTVFAALKKIGCVIDQCLDTNIDLVIKSGGHVAIVWAIVCAMKAFPNSSKIQAIGSRDLLLINAKRPKEFSTQIATVGGFEAILGAMTKFPDKEDLQRVGCAALYCLIGGGGVENANRFVNLNGLPVIVAAMKKFPHSETLQYSCCKLFGFLAGYVHLKYQIEKAGGLEVLGASIKHYPLGSRVSVYAKATMERVVI